MIVVNIIENLMITVIIVDMEVNWVVKVMKGSMVYMTERFRLGYVCGDYGLIDNDEWIDLHSMSENSEKNVQICINKMNELADENVKLKQENNELKKQLKDCTKKAKEEIRK